MVPAAAAAVPPQIHRDTAITNYVSFDRQTGRLAPCMMRPPLAVLSPTELEAALRAWLVLRSAGIEAATSFVDRSSLLRVATWEELVRMGFSQAELMEEWQSAWAGVKDA